MKISYNWLKTLINLNNPLEELCDKLSMSGLEVEGIEQTESIKGGLEGLIVGEILEVQKHPNADKLSLTKVNIGSEEPLSIVCGASNVARGQKVIVAPVGATIHPTGKEAFKIKKAKIRGEESQGMICAEDEIGLGNNHDGILVLPSETLIGIAASSIFPVETDQQIEVAITPNRGDAVSHLGIARELQALTGIRYRKPGTETFDARGPLRVDVEIETPENCPRYTGISISNIKVKPSPEWLQNRLRSIGLKPLNNIVDVTNYVLHEIGQPIHAFDLDLIEGRQIIVRHAHKGEKIVTLDQEERELQEFNLMICDSKKPLAIAGVFGGLQSGVNERTRNIFIESAYFNPVSIRKTAKYFGLNTEASYRYERGTDPNITLYALQRVVNLIQKVAGGEVASEIVDIYPNLIEDVDIAIKLDELNTFSGHPIPKEDVINILQNLEIKIAANNGENLLLKVPPYRPDVTRPVDIYEEILRIYGFNNIPIPAKVNYVPSVISNTAPNKLQSKIANYLSAMGFNEIITNSLSHPRYYDDNTTKNIELMNPLSREMSVLRSDLLHSALHTLAYNINRKIHDLKFFEFGKIYLKDDSRFSEKQVLQLVATGRRDPEHWSRAKQKIQRHHIRALAEQVLHKLNIPKKYQEYIIRQEPVDSKTLKLHHIKQEVQSLQLDWDLCLQYASEDFTLNAVPLYPVVRRDLSLIMARSVSFGDILKIAETEAGKFFHDINLFDVYEGKPLRENEKSFSVAVFLYNPEKTMTDNEIDSIMNRLISQYELELNALIRK